MPKDEFTIDQDYYNTFVNGYNLTGQIFLFLLDDNSGYVDWTGYYFVEKGNNTDAVILETLEPWIMQHVELPESAPAKKPVKIAQGTITSKISTAQLKKTKVTKFDNIDWSKARVLDKKSFVKK